MKEKTGWGGRKMSEEGRRGTKTGGVERREQGRK